MWARLIVGVLLCLIGGVWFGQGIGVIHGWRFQPGRAGAEDRPDLGEFRPQTRDLYIPPSDMGFWQGALRDPDDPLRDGALKAVDNGELLTVDVLYGDIQGGQRAISRFMLQPPGGQPRPGQPRPGEPGEARPGEAPARWIATVIRHWRIDGHDPR